MNSKKMCIVLLMSISVNLWAQENSKWFASFQGEFPTIRLSGDKIESQQLDLKMGYLITDNLSMSFILGSGLMGSNSTINPCFYNFTHLGINSDYMVQVNKATKLGLDLAVSSGFSNGNESNLLIYNSRFMNYQGGIKAKIDNAFAILGIRNRQFITSGTNNTELFYALGYTFPTVRRVNK